MRRIISVYSEGFLRTANISFQQLESEWKAETQDSGSHSCFC